MTFNEEEGDGDWESDYQTKMRRPGLGPRAAARNVFPGRQAFSFDRINRIDRMKRTKGIKNNFISYPVNPVNPV